jgi:tetratricopeptide (TPR) repeat protein
MTKKATATKQKESKPAARTSDGFQAEVERALKRFDRAAWLGRHSPLATPYFLGDRAPVKGAAGRDETARGQALQQLLREAAAPVGADGDGAGAQRARLLELAYFDAADRSVTQICFELNLGEATYHRHRNAAIAELAQAVIRLVRPALRLETPVPPPRLLGRDEALAHALAALGAGKSVAVSGPGGVGKTALGGAIARRFAPGSVFWHTFAPGLNDHTRSLLFALGYFLHGQGASLLWSQLVADRGEVREAVALNLLRHDLSTLHSRPLLFCFDEVDLLRPGEIEAHTGLLPWLESLRSLVPLLLMGQKPPVESDLHLPLTGLALEACRELLHQADLPLDEVELARLHQYTQGNPRLLELFIALAQSLQRAGGPVADALGAFAHEPSVEWLLRRIWRHLNETEMYFLELLAVFRNAAPYNAWTDQAQRAALEQLIAWRLVQRDGGGGVRLLTAFRDAIHQSLLTSEERELLHLEAATLRAQYGQYTSAAYHYVAGGEPHLAVRLLYAHREEEIDQGQAEAALAVLHTVSQRRLPPADGETLTLLRAELQKLLGQYDEARQTLQRAYWRIPFLQAQAWRLEGDIAELRGEAPQAQRAYHAGLETIEQLLSESAYFHRDLGYLYINEVDFARADQTILRMRHEAANLAGYLAENRSDLAGAALAYGEALELARAAGYPYGEANTHNNLGRIHAWRRELAGAEAHLQAAIDFFQATGRLNKMASATFNLALAQRLAGRYREALPTAQAALGWFLQLGEEFGRAVAHQLLAEIHLALGDPARAEHFARLVLDEERTNMQPDGLRVLGEIRLHQGQLAEAERLIRSSLTIAEANENRILMGYAWRALGEVGRAAGDYNQMQSSFHMAAQIFTALGLDAELDQLPPTFRQHLVGRATSPTPPIVTLVA